MRFAVAAAAMAGVAAASVAPSYDGPKNGTAPSYVTEVVTAYETYCPEPTEITHAGETYTVSEATTLTITNCPGGCTVTKPATSSVVSICHDCEPTAVPAEPTHEAPAEHTSEAPVKPEEPEHESTPVAPVPVPAESEAPAEPEHETPAAPVAPYPSSNGTTPVVNPAPSGTGAPTESTEAAPFEGSASAITASGAGLLAVFGLVALL